MTIGLIQSLTEMSTRSKAQPVPKTDNCLENVASSMSHNSMGLHGLLQGSFYFLDRVT
jgi:hypothetical protein